MILPRRGGLKTTIEFTSVDLPTPLARAAPGSAPARVASTVPGGHRRPCNRYQCPDFQYCHESIGPRIDFLDLLAPSICSGVRFPAPRRNTTPRFDGNVEHHVMSCSIRRMATPGSSPMRNFAISVDRPRTGQPPVDPAARPLGRWQDRGRSQADAARRATGSEPPCPCDPGSRLAPAGRCLLVHVAVRREKARHHELRLAQPIDRHSTLSRPVSLGNR